MNLTTDAFRIVCSQADKDGFHCPGANEFGACRIYTNSAVRFKAQRGCAFREVRVPIVVKGAKARVGQQKQTKHKAKAS